MSSILNGFDLANNATVKSVIAYVQQQAQVDSAHDFSHYCRVAGNALAIADDESDADREVLILAALLHDVHNLPKGHPDAKNSSLYSAEAARSLLQRLNYPSEKTDLVYDAILCHSYSLGKLPSSLEGRIFQDADRLEALGAIGIARCFAVAGIRNSLFYFPEDPFLRSGRQPDDKSYAVDHFYQKLFKVADTMLTPSGRRMAQQRLAMMNQFLKQLETEAHTEIELLFRAIQD